MKIRIPFWPRFRDPMVDGVKVWTSRTKKYGKAGDWFEAFGCIFELVVVVKKTLEFVARNWSEEGCSSRDDFIEIWNQIHPRKGYIPDWEVWIHIFKKIDRKPCGTLGDPNELRITPGKQLKRNHRDHVNCRSRYSGKLSDFL